MADDNVQRFLDHATACDEAASSVHDREIKYLYTDLAKQWRELARQTEKLHRDRQ